MKLSDWLAWQETLHPSAIDMGLDRCGAVAERLGVASLPCPVVTIAGTNGKGSSAVLLAGILSAAGYRTGCYTSPHLVRYNERVRVAGTLAADEDLCRAFERIDAARGDISLTYFEFGTLAAFLVFAESRLDVCVLEVGMGGRLDAVNLLAPRVALITAIGLDHMEWLGPDRDAIALEKAGILRAGGHGVCSDPDIPPALGRAAEALGCRLDCLGVDYHFETEGDRWHWWNAGQTRFDLPRPAMAGLHQLTNAAGVLQVLTGLESDLPVDAAAVHTGLTQMHLPGRLHTCRRGAEFVLDVAHNPQAAQTLAAALQALAPARQTFVILGMMRDKDHAGVIAALDADVAEWHLVDLPAPRGLPAADLARKVARTGKRVRSHASVAEACEALRRCADKDDRIVVTGSFVTVGEALQYLAPAGS